VQQFIRNSGGVISWHHPPGTTVPPAAPTHKRLYHNVRLHARPNVYVWQSTGTTTTAPPTVTHKRLYHNIRAHDRPGIYIWQNVGTTATIGGQTVKRRYQNWQLYNTPGVYLWNHAGATLDFTSHKRPYHNWSIPRNNRTTIVWQSAGHAVTPTPPSTVNKDGLTQAMLAALRRKALLDDDDEVVELYLELLHKIIARQLGK